MISRDIAEMRKLLVQHGYQVPQRDYSYQPKPRPKPVAAEARHDSSATLGEGCDMFSSELG
jgi:hypothetical protein